MLLNNTHLVFEIQAKMPAMSGIHWDMSPDVSSGLAAALLGDLVSVLDKVSGYQTF